MRREGFRLAAAICAGLVAACAGRAQDLTGEQILARAYERYASIRDFQATATVGMETGRVKSAARVELAYRRPGHLYISVQDAAPMILVQDGQTRWTYMGALDQYTKERVKPGRLTADSQFSNFGMLGGTFLALALLEGEAIVDSLARPSLLPEAEIEGSPCYVISLPIESQEAGRRGHASLYFDKERMVLLAAEGVISVAGAPGAEMRIREAYRGIRLDAGIPDERFAFQPPKGAKLVREFGPAEREKPELVGKPAPDFKVKDLSGNVVSLSDYRGKVLLLDFWATWCPPCREEMPDIQRIYEEGKDKGLAVLAISQDEDARDVKRFIRQHKLTLPIAMDEDGKAGYAYGAETIPTTLLIDGNGTVRSGFKGLTSGEALAEEISRLGVRLQGPNEREPTDAERRTEEARRHRDAGLKMFLLGRYEEAERELRAAAEATPDDSTGWLTLGEFHLKTSRLEQARAAFDRAFEAAARADDVAWARAAAARAYLDADVDYNAALEHAREAVRLDPQAAEYWSALGWACYKNGMHEQAVSNLAKALKLNPRDGLAHYRLGAVYESQGQADLARAEYEAAVKFDPSLEDARRALQRLGQVGEAAR